MRDEITGENAPAILVLIEVIRDYRMAGDRDGFCNLLFEVEKAISGEEYEEPKAAAEKFTFRRLLAKAREGIGKYAAMAQRGKAGASARWGGEVTAARSQQAAAKPAPRQLAVPRPAPLAGGARRADGGEDLGSMAFRDPVRAALIFTGETGDRRAENTLKKRLREIGADRFRMTLESFMSECEGGEPVRNRGAAFSSRLMEVSKAVAAKGKPEAKGGEA